jgi:transcriptional regulator with XRE-family HTH domain
MVFLGGERMSINSNLRLLREASGLTQEQVAEKIGITRQALSSFWIYYPDNRASYSKMQDTV